MTLTDPRSVAAIKPSARTVALGSAVGTTIEWYDFYLYATAAALVFKPLFFPNISSTAGTLASFATYAAGFGARPLGALISGHYGDRLGRKAVLVAALVGMGLSTFAIGLLPTYAQAGLLAPALLVTLRLLQGLAVGAEWGGAALLSVEHAPPGRRGLFGSFTQLGSPAGMLLSTAIFYVTRTVIGPDAFLAYGWRIPFLLSAVLVIIGLVIRLRLTDAEVFTQVRDRGEVARLPVLEVLRTQPRNVLITTGLRFSQIALFVLLTTYSLTYLQDSSSAGSQVGLTAVLIASAIGLVSTPVWAMVSDRYGRRPPYLFGAVAGLLALSLFFVAAGTGSHIAIVLSIVFGINIAHDSMYGPQAAWFGELFDTRVRYSGASLGYQIGAVLSGGFAPLIAAALLVAGGGSPWLIVGYFAVLTAITSAAAYFARETHLDEIGGRTMTRIYLNAFDMACVGHQSAGLWRHPEDQGYRYRELGYWTDLARTLEAGGFDALFLADVLGVYDVYGGSRDAAVADAAQVPVNDPTLMVSAMAAVTETLGFGVTVSLTYEQPYALARRLSTLDHLTGGRVAWNIVTSYLDSTARNLGLDAQIPHDERYEIAEEYLEVCYKLWEASWEPGAVVRDRERGVFTDPAKVHDIEHKGRYFSVPGPFLCEPSPQRTPMLFQAGASPRGVRFAAAHAEAVFVSGPTPEIVAKPVKALRAAAAEQGRDPQSIKVFTMLTPIVAETHDLAVAKLHEYRQFVSADGALALFGGWTGVDLAELEADEPLKYVQTEANRSALASFTTSDRNWTAGELAQEVGLGGRGPVVVGSPTEVADELERWVDEAGVDGFNLAYVTTPGTFVDFARHVVPELRRRGRVPGQGERVTLRERLGGAGPLLSPDHPGAAFRPPSWGC